MIEVRNRDYFMKIFNGIPINDRLYIIFAVLSLFLYVFGHSTDWGQLPFPDKMFYIPCAVTLLIAFFSPKYWIFSKSDKLYIAFWIIAFFNTILFVNITIETIFNSLIGYLIFRHLTNVDYKLVIRLLLYLTPLVVAIHYIYSTPLTLAAGHRYGGFQGDRNCFSFAINVFVFVCGYMLNYDSIKWHKILSLVCIAFIFPLLFAAASRGNIAIAVLITAYSFRDMLKTNKLIAIVVVVVALNFGGRYIARFATQLEQVTNRYQETEGSSEYRTQELSIVPALLLAHPEYIPFGIGYNESLHAHSRFPYEYYHVGRCHNSYMSVLLEEGAVGFILFMCFLYYKGKSVFDRRHFPDGKYKLMMMFAILFFFYTIYCLPFLPFWFLLNLISSKNNRKGIKYVKTKS